jgi:hypothetical protein
MNAWNREIGWFKEKNFSYESIALILGKNAFDFFNIKTSEIETKMKNQKCELEVFYVW